jgi:hypothetical protein
MKMLSIAVLLIATLQSEMANAPSVGPLKLWQGSATVQRYVGKGQRLLHGWCYGQPKEESCSFVLLYRGRYASAYLTFQRSSDTDPGILSGIYLESRRPCTRGGETTGLASWKWNGYSVLSSAQPLRVAQWKAQRITGGHTADRETDYTNGPYGAGMIWSPSHCSFYLAME